MGDNATTEVEPAAEPKDEAKGLRGQLEKALKERDGFRNTIMADAYAGLGLDTTAGLGKAIAKEYDGEASQEALAEYAKNEYGYEAPVVENVNPQAQAINESQGRLDAMGIQAGSIAPPTQADELAKAEAEGNTDVTIAMKGQQLDELLHP